MSHSVAPDIPTRKAPVGSCHSQGARCGIGGFLPVCSIPWVEDKLSSGRYAFTFWGCVTFYSFDTMFSVNEINGHIIVVDRNSEPPGFPQEKLPPAKWELPPFGFHGNSALLITSSACCKHRECRPYESWPGSNMQLQLGLLVIVPGKVSWERSWQCS